MKRSGIKRSAEKTREWVQRSRERAAEAAREKPRPPLPRSSELRRSPGPVARARQLIRAQEGPLSPYEWKMEVWRLDKGKCRECGKPVPKYGGLFTWHAHHVIAKQLLRARKLYHLVWDVRNGVLLCHHCHSRHENGLRIHRTNLPRRLASFLTACGPWTRDVLDRQYAAAASSGDDESREGPNDGRRRDPRWQRL